MSLIYINPYVFTVTGTGWTPANITTQLWLDASDSATITTVSSKVSQWNDKSGNTRNATQSTDANRPTYTTAGLNGLNVITFTTASFQSMVMSSVISSGASSGSIFWVQKNTFDPPTVTEDIGSFISKTWGTPSPYNHFPFLDGDVYMGAFRNTRINAGNPTPSLTTPRIVGIESNSSSYKMLIDGTSFYTGGGSFALPPSSVTIGEPALYAFRGYAAELIVVDSILSTGDREKIEGYLAHKWGITSGLPSGHPYKSVAPSA
tara:strand:+ start:2677 stop:3462 length:786 start_codon:yes stop_codon:yes gene_type:complete